MLATTQSRRAAAWPALISLSLLLPACGGGGDDPIGATTSERGAVASEPSPSTAATQPLPATAPASVPASEVRTDASPGPVVTPGAGLLPEDPVTLDTGRFATRVVKSLGALQGGGYAVAWMVRQEDEPDPSWRLWLQRFDPRGRKAGPAVRLDYPRDVAGPDDVAVTVLPEGRVGVTFVTDRMQDDAFMISQVHYWPFNLEGTISGEVRVLDTERYARFSPRFARLNGPLTAAIGRDGSQYVAWRYQIVGAAPLAPSVRAQRLAADGEPLDWIQRLDGMGGWSRVEDVDITPLDEGGWVVAQERVSAEGVRYRTFTQLDLARPLQWPQEEVQSAFSFLLDLRGHGSVLFSQPVDPATGVTGPASQIHFTALGRERPPRPLPRLPIAAVALAGGDYVILQPDFQLLSGQRYTPAGEPVGAPFDTSVSVAEVLSAGLRGGGMALAWVVIRTDGEMRLLSQRFAPPAP